MKLEKPRLVGTLLCCLALAAGCGKSSPTSSGTPSDSSANPSGAPEASASSPAAAPADTPEPPPPPPIVIPAGTVLTVTLQQALGSKTSQDGQSFDAALSVPIVVDDKTVIPKGASAGGVVTEAHAAGRFKGGATLNLALTSLMIRGQRREIQTAALTQETKGKGKRTAGMVGGGAAGGAAIGAIAGGGKGAGIGALVGAGAGTVGAAFTGNRDIKLPVETAVSFKLTSPITIKQKASEQ